MNDPKISLIICAYNEENYIGKCLESVIKNSRDKLFEILVVNNASSDNTRKIAEKYSEVRVVDEKQKGQVRARQRGFLEARGDILAYIDADELMPEGWIETIEKEFSDNKNLACLSGPCVFYDFASWRNFFVKLYWYLLAYPSYLVTGYMVLGGNFAIRKAILEKMNGFNTSIEFYGEDTDIARRASAFGKVKFKLNFIIQTSARRFYSEGLLKTNYIYISNFISQVFAKKSMTKNYTDIR